MNMTGITNLTTDICTNVYSNASKKIISAEEALVYMSNAQICQQIGFLDDNYFYRVFRKQTGLTPRQYRDSILADTAKTE